MADILDKLKALNTAYDIVGGAKEVVDSTKLVLDSAKAVNKLAKDVRKGGKSAALDWRKLEKTLGADSRELERLNRHWTSQARDVQAAADAAWPPIKNDARKRFASLIALEKSEGADSPVFKRALYKTSEYISECELSMRERASYCAMVAEKADAMHDAFMDANEAIDHICTLFKVSLVAFAHASGAAAATAFTHLNGIQKTIRNRPKAVAKAYAALAKSARAQERVQLADSAVLDKILKTLGKMILSDAVDEARDYLKDLFKAA